MALDLMSFDFGSDDVLCSYVEYTPPMDVAANAKWSDPTAKDLHEGRAARPLVDLYGEQDVFLGEEVLSSVEKCMTECADVLIKHLEGISGRLTQLELCCYKLERSVGEFLADTIRDRREADLRLKSLEKHIHEVHRAVQIIRDKQELHETHVELANLQLSQKDSIQPTRSQETKEGIKEVAPSPNKSHGGGYDVSNWPSALPLPVQHLNAAANQTAYQALFPPYHQHWPQPSQPPRHVSLACLGPIDAGFVGTSAHPPQPSAQAYGAFYVIDGNRAAQVQGFPIGNHFYGDVMEKSVNMPP